jgi:hypothetical protein
MAAIKSLAKGHTKITALAAPPANKNAITVTALTAGTDLSAFIALSNFALGSTGSSTTDDPSLEQTANFQALEGSNYEGHLEPFRYFDADTKLVDEEADVAFQMMKEKGTLLYLVKRVSAKLGEEDWATGDEYSYYEAYTDDPQAPASDTGYVKCPVDLAISEAVEFKTVVVGA